MTATSGQRFCTCCTSHRPPWPGMRRSVTTSGVSLLLQQGHRLLGRRRRPARETKGVRRPHEHIQRRRLVVDKRDGTLLEPAFCMHGVALVPVGFVAGETLPHGVSGPTGEHPVELMVRVYRTRAEHRKQKKRILRQIPDNPHRRFGLRHTSRKRKRRSAVRHPSRKRKRRIAVRRIRAGSVSDGWLLRRLRFRLGRRTCGTLNILFRASVAYASGFDAGSTRHERSARLLSHRDYLRNLAARGRDPGSVDRQHNRPGTAFLPPSGAREQSQRPRAIRDRNTCLTRRGVRSCSRPFARWHTIAAGKSGPSTSVATMCMSSSAPPRNPKK